MNAITMALLFGIGPLLALVIGALGVELMEETFFGWLLFLTGASYPPGVVIYYQRHLKASRKPDGP